MPLFGREAVDKAIIKTVKKTNTKLRKIYLQGFAEVVIGTPVDEGRARGNWFYSELTPSSETTSNTTPSFDEVRKVAKQVLGKKIFFTNNLPYIGVLEFGGFKNKKGTEKVNRRHFSKLAPRGWVRTTLKRMRKRIKLI